MRRTVNDSTTRSALGTDRKEREVQTPRKTDAGTAAQHLWLPEAQSEGSGDSAHGVLHLELAARHCAGPSDRCVLGVVQTLAEIYLILEEEGVFLSDAAKARLPELVRQFHLLYNQPLVPRGVGRSHCGQRMEDAPEDAPVHPFDGVASD